MATNSLTWHFRVMARCDVACWLALLENFVYGCVKSPKSEILTG